MMRLLPAALAALALSLAACSDPSEAYTPVDELPSTQDPVAGSVDTPSPVDDAMHEPAPPEPLPPVDPEIPPPMDPAPPIDDASRPPPVDPALEDESPTAPAS